MEQMKAFAGSEESMEDKLWNRQMEEFKLLAEDRRFMMTRYMQGIAIYFALVGFSLKELIETSQFSLKLVLGVFLSTLNILSYIATRYFWKTANHSIERETELAITMQILPPHTLVWGVYIGITAFCIVEMAIVVILFLL